MTMMRLAVGRRFMSTVSVTISEAQTKTAAALRKIGWDSEDAALRKRAQLCDVFLCAVFVCALSIHMIARVPPP